MWLVGGLDPLDLDAAPSEEAECPLQEAGGALLFLVGQDFGVGEPERRCERLFGSFVKGGLAGTKCMSSPSASAASCKCCLQTPFFATIGLPQPPHVRKVLGGAECKAAC
jgi:hypothetical protein